MKKEYTVPEVFHATSFVSHFPRKDVKKGVIEALHYILDHIITYPEETEKGREIIEERGGVPIFMKLLRSEVGRNHSETAMRLLLENKVIRRTGEYSFLKRRASVYILDPTFDGGTIRVPSTLEISPISKKNNHNSDSIPEEEQISESQVQLNILHLGRFLSDPRLSINNDATNFYLQSTFNDLLFLRSHHKTKYTGKKKKEYQEAITREIYRQFNRYADAALKINQNGFYFSVSETNHRFNSAITQLNKVLRNFLTFDGETLVQLDITASQPYLLLWLMKEIPSLEGSTSPINHLYTNLHTYTNTNSLHMMATLKAVHGLSEELDIFTELFGGDFYNNLQEKMRTVDPENKSDFKNRKATKTSFMFLLFGQFKGKSRGFSTYRTFEKAFPSILRLMDILKSEKPNFLALLLQRLESHVLLDGVVDNLKSNLPSVPIFTIHDAILTPTSQAENVNRIMIETLEEITGLRPQVKKTTLDGSMLIETPQEAQEMELAEIQKKLKRNKHKLGPSDASPKLLTHGAPNWKGKDLITFTVWEQLRDQPLQKIIAEFMSKIPRDSLKAVVTKPVKALTLGSHIEVNGSTQIMADLKPGHIVPVWGFLNPDEKKEAENDGEV
jgi:hypothetical protein